MTKAVTRLPNEGGGEEWHSWESPLAFLCEKVEAKSVLECGMGRGTDRILSIPGLELITSIDQDSRWREECSTDDPRHESYWAMLGEPEWVRTTGLGPWDVALVDGVSASRVATIQWLAWLGKCPWIVAHDFGFHDRAAYLWDWLHVPGWFGLRVDGVPPSGILCNSEDRMSWITERLEQDGFSVEPIGKLTAHG